MSHVFISYSRKNNEYARKLADQLLGLGFDVWIDDRIDYGEDWWRAIVRAIKACSAFVVVMSPDSGESRWVQREVTLAYELRKPTFPLLLEGDLISSDYWAIFVRAQYADVRGGKMPPEEFFHSVAQLTPRRTTPGREVVALLPTTGTLPDPQALDATEPLPALTTPSPLTPPHVLSALPEPFAWCEVPAGNVILEDTPGGGGRGGKYQIPAFLIAKYPITNLQYETFLTEGYPNPRWWDYSAEAEQWRRGVLRAKDSGTVGDGMPRTKIAWYDAVAFCRWLSQTLQLTGLKIMLPTEQQWQRAAQGDTGRNFPWGNTFETTRANTEESGLGKATPVIRYPSGASPYAGWDMVGNVWEWCLNEWGTDSISIKGAKARAVRGGSYNSDAKSARCGMRDADFPDTRSGTIGFRVVCVNDWTGA
ncbi:MAG: SUMF1/EgtB/PvdO family nonheme iron enzyme [Chloroflexi bacterium]|nr:SUMF1/EgtB/PvdO family nonheme iron enzyme [Chloroflexota bacterium]